MRVRVEELGLRVMASAVCGRPSEGLITVADVVAGGGDMELAAMASGESRLTAAVHHIELRDGDATARAADLFLREPLFFSDPPMANADAPKAPASRDT